MNKLGLTGILCFFFLGVHAQKPNFKLRINPYAGYETNLLKSPTRYQPKSGDIMGMNDLWTNAPFVGANNRLSVFDQKKKHMVELTGNYRKSILPVGSEVAASDFLTGLAYRFDTKKKVKNELKFGFRNYIKTGEDLDNIIGVPLSYRRFNMSNTLDVKLSKKALFTVTPASTLKFYDRPGFEEFRYMENGIETGLTYRYKYKRKVGFGLFANVRQRDYTIGKEGDFEEEEEAQRRKWRYYSGGIGMRFPINEKLKLTTRADYTFREDILQSLLGYHQYELRLGVNYKHKKWKAELNTSAFYRNYTNFMVTVNDEKVALDYLYVKYMGKLSYAATNNFSLVLRSAGKLRYSNVNNVNRRTFRSYMIGEVSLGLVYTIQPRKKLKTYKH